jgi:hypothetical protein
VSESSRRAVYFLRLDGKESPGLLLSETLLIDAAAPQLLRKNFSQLASGRFAGKRFSSHNSLFKAL